MINSHGKIKWNILPETAASSLKDFLDEQSKTISKQQGPIGGPEHSSEPSRDSAEPLGSYLGNKPRIFNVDWPSIIRSREVSGAGHDNPQG